MKKSLLVAIGVLLGIGGWCRADEASCRQAVEELFNQTGMPAALDQMVVQISATLTGAAPEDANYGDAMNAYVRKYIRWEAMKDELAALYMRTFSEQELRELIAFYGTPTGRKFLQQSPALGQEIAAAVHRRLVENSPELKKMMMDADLKVFQDALGQNGTAPASKP